MSQIVIGITDEQLRRVDALSAKSGKSREQIAIAGLELALAEPEPKPIRNHRYAAPKTNAGAQEEE